MMAEYPKVVYKKHTFFSALITGFVLLIITLVICVTVLLIYGMHFVGERSEAIITIAENAVHGLPAFQESLPPVLADMLNDHREPDYRDELEVTVQPSISPNKRDEIGAAIKVVNKGPDVVTLLTLRIVVLNSNDEILTESNEWVVTPFAIENDWPGPFMPGSERYFSTSRRSVYPIPSANELRAEAEITDIRIWNGQKEIKPSDINEPPGEIMTERLSQAFEERMRQAQTENE
jgi:hypothetical protein